MKKESDEIPMEILLYNIIKFMPSPINKSINLSFLSSLRFPFKEKGNNLNGILAPLNIASREEKMIPNIFFHQLSGYPIMDLNMCFLFNLLPINIILEAFIFSF